VGRRVDEKKSRRGCILFVLEPDSLIFLFVVLGIARGGGRGGMTDRKEGQILAEHNGQCFRFNELVHVWEGTTPGVRAKKTEFIKAWLKGVDAAMNKFICRPVVGHSRGLFRVLPKGQYTNKRYSE
jgi:hypothetical protein